MGFKERRLDERASMALSVTIQVDAFEEPRSGITADVSESGMFVETFRPEPIGSLIKFELQLSEAGAVVRGVGEVVWIRLRDQGPRSPAGMGIRFGHLSDRARLALKGLLLQEKQGGG